MQSIEQIISSTQILCQAEIFCALTLNFTIFREESCSATLITRTQFNFFRYSSQILRCISKKASIVAMIAKICLKCFKIVCASENVQQGYSTVIHKKIPLEKRRMPKHIIAKAKKRNITITHSAVIC